MTMRVRPLSTSLRRGVFALVALAALAGCRDSLATPGPGPLGLLQVDVDGDAAATKTVPTVTFIRAYGLNIADTRNAGDTCNVIAFNEGSDPTTPIEGVDAGQSLSLALSGTTTPLVANGSAVGRVYAPAGNATVTFQPGDTAKLNIPGASGGFPALDFAIRTAEPVVFNAIPTPDAGDSGPETVTWTAGDETSTMLLSLRYQNPTVTGIQQVLCIMRDDGSFDISSSRLTTWRAAATTQRRAVATRIRTRGVAANGSTFYGESSFQKTVPLAAAQP